VQAEATAYATPSAARIRTVSPLSDWIASCLASSESGLRALRTAEGRFFAIVFALRLQVVIRD